MVGILGDNVTQAPAVGKLLFVILQMQHDAGTALGLVNGFYIKLAFTLGRPEHALFRLQTGTAGEHLDLFCHDEGRVETDPELTNQLGILFLVSGQLLHELGSTGLGDGTQMGQHIITAHADGVVFDGQGIGVLVEADTDFQLRIVFQQLGLGQCLKTQLVGGIRCVGYQLAQENLLVGIQGVNHQVQQLLDLGLETEGLFLCIYRHWVLHKDLLQIR